VPLLGDELAAGDAVAALRRYSLVTPAGDGLVSVHRLVQALITPTSGLCRPGWCRRWWRPRERRKGRHNPALVTDTLLPNECYRVGRPADSGLVAAGR
jgi:hypothetical protein